MRERWQISFIDHDDGRVRVDLYLAEDGGRAAEPDGRNDPWVLFHYDEQWVETSEAIPVGALREGLKIAEREAVEAITVRAVEKQMDKVGISDKTTDAVLRALDVAGSHFD